MNFLSNASKFTSEGEIEFTAKMLRKDDIARKAEVLFSVRDTGIGMDPESQKRLFRPFQQVCSSPRHPRALLHVFVSWCCLGRLVNDEEVWWNGSWSFNR